MKTYIFQISLPEHAGVSRKIELPAAWTLEDLHYAVQEAFGFDASPVYSFFMSGEWGDEASEYTLPDEVDAAQSTGAAPDADTTIEPLPPESRQEAEPGIQPVTGQPTPQDIRQMLRELKQNPELRAQVAQTMTEQLGIPQFMLDMVLSNADTLLDLLPADLLTQALAPQTEAAADVAGDVRVARLDSLGLTVGQDFLYLYESDAQWRFNLRVDAAGETELSEHEYPKVLESIGAAPRGQ